MGRATLCEDRMGVQVVSDFSRDRIQCSPQHGVNKQGAHVALRLQTSAYVRKKALEGTVVQTSVFY